MPLQEGAIPVSMNDDSRTTPASPEAPRVYEPPTYLVIDLACEITAYAPAGDEPLF